MTDGRDLAAKKTKPGRAPSASQARSNAAAAADAAPTDDECRGRNPGLRGAAPEYTRDYSATVGVRLLRTPSAIRCACTRIGNAVLSGTLDPKKANSALYAVAGAKAAMDLEQQAKALELEQQRVNIEAARSNIAAQLPADPAESMRAYLALMNGDDAIHLESAVVAPRRCPNPRRCLHPSPRQPQSRYRRPPSASCSPIAGPTPQVETQQHTGASEPAASPPRPAREAPVIDLERATDGAYAVPPEPPMPEEVAAVARTFTYDPSDSAQRRAIRLGYEMLREGGITLISVPDPGKFVSDTPEAVLIRQIRGAISEFERSTIVSKLRVARMRKRASGKKVEGRKSHRELLVPWNSPGSSGTAIRTRTSSVHTGTSQRSLPRKDTRRDPARNTARALSARCSRVPPSARGSAPPPVPTAPSLF